MSSGLFPLATQRHQADRFPSGSWSSRGGSRSADQARPSAGSAGGPDSTCEARAGGARLRDRARAVVLNVTGGGPPPRPAASSSPSTPGDAVMPDASNLDFTQGETIANLVVVKSARAPPPAKVKPQLNSHRLHRPGRRRDGLASRTAPNASFQAWCRSGPMDTRSGIGVAPDVVQARRDHHAHRRRRQHGRPPAPWTGAVVLEHVPPADLTGNQLSRPSGRPTRQSRSAPT